MLTARGLLFLPLPTPLAVFMAVVFLPSLPLSLVFSVLARDKGLVPPPTSSCRAENHGIQ